MSDVIRRGLLGKVVEDILRQTLRQVSGNVAAVVWVGAGLAAFDRYTPASIRTGQVGRKVQKEEVIPEWRTVRLHRGAWANGQNFVRTRPIKSVFGPEHLGVRVSLHSLADGGSRVVHPSPTTHDELGCRTLSVGKG